MKRPAPEYEQGAEPDKKRFKSQEKAKEKKRRRKKKKKKSIVDPTLPRIKIATDAPDPSTSTAPTLGSSDADLTEKLRLQTIVRLSQLYTHCADS
jgi:hypothetical protein